jgi:hypothetical protein
MTRDHVASHPGLFHCRHMASTADGARGERKNGKEEERRGETTYVCKNRNARMRDNGTQSKSITTESQQGEEQDNKEHQESRYIVA